MNASHGGPDALGAPRWDFSTNANACGPCPQALDAVHRADARRYPDPAYTDLRAALAQDRPAVIDCVIDPAESMRQAIYSPLALEAARGVRPAV